MNPLFEALKIADIHVDRIEESLSSIQHLLPFDEKVVSEMIMKDLLWVELLVSRFGKLQDLMGRTIIEHFLNECAESSDKFTILDKVNQLERMHIIDNAQIWKQMRDARNRIAHEYPDQPALTAKYLNEIVHFSPQLIKMLENIKNRL